MKQYCHLQNPDSEMLVIKIYGFENYIMWGKREQEVGVLAFLIGLDKLCKDV